MLPFAGNLAEAQAEEREVVKGASQVSDPPTYRAAHTHTTYTPRTATMAGSRCRTGLGYEGLYGNLSYRGSKMLPFAEARVDGEVKGEGGRLPIS